MSETQTITTALTFSETDQSIWGGGRSATYLKRIPIIDIHEEIGPSSLDIGLGTVSVSSAMVDFELAAVIGFTAGAISLDYPLEAIIETPAEVLPGQSFSVQTRAVVGAMAPLITTTSPGITSRIEISAEAGVSNLYFDAARWEVDLGPFGSFDANPLPDIALGSPHLGPYNRQIDIPISGTVNLGPVSLTITEPAPFTTTGTAFAAGPGVLRPLRTSGDQFDNDESGGLDAGFLTVSGNVLNLAQIPFSLKTTKFEFTTLAVNLIGSVGFAQQYTFTPTAVNMTMRTG